MASKSCKTCDRLDAIGMLITKPSYEELKKLIDILPNTHIDEKYGVKDPFVYEWIKRYEKQTACYLRFTKI